MNSIKKINKSDRSDLFQVKDTQRILRIFTDLQSPNEKTKL